MYTTQPRLLKDWGVGSVRRPKAYITRFRDRLLNAGFIIEDIQEFSCLSDYKEIRCTSMHMRKPATIIFKVENQDPGDDDTDGFYDEEILYSIIYLDGEVHNVQEFSRPQDVVEEALAAIRIQLLGASNTPPSPSPLTPPPEKHFATH